MSLTQEIDDIYIQYCLSNKSIGSLKQLTNKSLPTLRRYITIKENLSYELFPLLNQRSQLTISFAELLCKKLTNTYQQEFVYDHVKKEKMDKKKVFLEEQLSCQICCDQSKTHEHMECCGQWICSQCLFQCFKTSTIEFRFIPLCCPFCKGFVSDNTIKEFTGSFITNSINYSHDPWRNNTLWIKQVTSQVKPSTYLVNLYYLYKQYMKYISHNHGITDTHHIGFCNKCLIKKYKSVNRFKEDMKVNNFRNINFNINIAKVQKDCANDEQLKPEIFVCDKCTESNIIKRCPHCGIKSMRPDGCNYVRCACGNHWCFVCNMRLPGTHEGHNVHYWIGRGSSAYDDKCRISESTDRIDHVLKKCNCSSCLKRSGAPICATLDCPNKVPCKPYKTEHGRLMKWGIYCRVCSTM